jgi:arylsulfatase A-like enzyme
MLVFCLLVLGGNLSCRPILEFEPKVIDAGASATALYGRVFSSRPVVLRLADGWSRGPDGDGWVLTTPGRLLVDIAEPVESRLTIIVETRDGELPGELRVLWNGLPLPAADVVFGLDGVIVSIQPEQTVQGVHEVVLQPFDGTDSGSHRRLRIAIERLAFTIDGETTEFDPARLPEDRWLARFQTFGVFPEPDGKLHSGGFVFDGPGSMRCNLSPPRAARLRVVVENRSSAPAVFLAEDGETCVRLEVAAGAAGPFDVPLVGGDNHLTLGVEGDDNGLFVWVRPRISPATPSSLPPIILITTDTTRRDVIPPYADRRELAPNLAHFADSATVFERAYSTAPWTLPSHASIFTGLYPTRHGAGVGGTTLGPRFSTLAERLARHGYRTAGMAGGLMCAAHRGLAQGFALYRDPDSNETRADSLTDGAIGWLDALDGATPFLFLNYFDPHYPYNPPDRYRTMGVKPLVSAGETTLTIGDLNAAMEEHGVLPPVIRRRLVAAYEGEVRFLDHEIGRLLRALERAGLYERAFIAIVSDHGEMLGENGFLFHSYRLDPELIHIPFIVKWPHQDRPAVVRSPVSLVDLFPTILELVGSKPPVSDGRVLPRADEDGRSRGDAVFAEEHSQRELNPLVANRRKIADHLWATATGDALTVVWDSGAQCVDLIDSGWRPSLCTPLRQEAARNAVHELGEFAATDRTGLAALSSDEREQLKALGYLP